MQPQRPDVQHQTPAARKSRCDASAVLCISTPVTKRPIPVAVAALLEPLAMDGTAPSRARMDPALRPMIIYERFESGGPLQKVRCPSPPTPSFSPGYSTHIVTVVLAELVLQVAQPTMVKVVALHHSQSRPSRGDYAM
jgi:hypothetical protein